MNSRERVVRAIERGGPDRIPLTHATLPGAVARYGQALADLYRRYPTDVENVGAASAQLFWRHWRIHDPVAGDHEVQGEGVVGETPLLDPGDVFEYNSFCVLRSPMGHMEGYYHFRRQDGSVFRAPIPRFFLQAPPGSGSHLA